MAASAAIFVSGVYMKIEAFKCDKCEKVITDTDGYCIQGNITFLNGGGLIGNNFDENGLCVKENHYCYDCLLEILYLK